jgi:hypothetical protein
MNYGMKHLNNYSIHAKNTLFVYDNINKDDFDINKENLVSQFTTQVTYLTPEDPLYHEVTKHTLNEKDKAIQNFGSNSRSTTNPTPTPPTEINTTTNSPHSVVSDMSTMIEGFAKAITDSTSKNLTGNEKKELLKLSKLNNSMNSFSPPATTQFNQTVPQYKHSSKQPSTRYSSAAYSKPTKTPKQPELCKTLLKRQPHPSPTTTTASPQPAT